MSKLECHFKTFLKSRVGVSIFGGVLSALALALIPNYAFASTDFSSDTSAGYFSAPVLGGCHFKALNANLENGLSKTLFLGDNFGLNESHMCGFGFDSQGNFTWFNDSRSFDNKIDYNNGTYTPHFEQANNQVMNHWNSTNSDSTKGSNTRNVLRNLYWNFDSPLVIQPSNSSELAVYMPFIIIYDNNHGDLGAEFTTPRIDNILSDIEFYKDNGDTLSTSELNTLKTTFYNNVNKSINLTCGKAPTSVPSSWSVPNNHCYVYGSFSLVAGYKYYFNDIVFTPSLSQSYNISVNGNILNEDFRFAFLHMNSIDYKTAGRGTNTNATQDVELGYFRFLMSYCMNENECQDFANILATQTQNRINNTTGGFEASNDTNLFMSWFNVFNFGFVFPFRYLLNSFTDGQTCVDIPIIGGMLYNPDVKYCSWWSSDIRNILTPVISIFNLILITSFVIRWVSGGSENSTLLKGGEVVKDNGSFTWSSKKGSGF